MHIVIDVPEKVYNHFCRGCRFFDEVEEAIIAITDGTPLPKGHGDLVDRKALLNNGYQMEPIEMWYGIKYADTIIKAEEEE